jgi:hypothetical protein
MRSDVMVLALSLSWRQTSRINDDLGGQIDEDRAQGEHEHANCHSMGAERTLCCACGDEEDTKKSDEDPKDRDYDSGDKLG